jgi:hypothetical protein
VDVGDDVRIPFQANRSRSLIQPSLRKVIDRRRGFGVKSGVGGQIVRVLPW